MRTTTALPALAAAVLLPAGGPARAAVQGGTTCGLAAFPTTPHVSWGQTHFAGAMSASAFIADGSVSVTCTLLVDADIAAQGTASGIGGASVAEDVDMLPWEDSSIELCTEVIFYGALGPDARVTCVDVTPQQSPPQPVCDMPPGCAERTYAYTVTPQPLDP